MLESLQKNILEDGTEFDNSIKVSNFEWGNIVNMSYCKPFFLKTNIVMKRDIIIKLLQNGLWHSDVFSANKIKKHSKQFASVCHRRQTKYCTSYKQKDQCAAKIYAVIVLPI